MRRRGGTAINNPIHVIDYNFDWVLDKHFVHPRAFAGSMRREEVLDFCGTLGIDGIDIRDEYWFDCTGEQLKKMASDAGIRIQTYLISEDLIVNPKSMQPQLDRVYHLLEKTAATGAKQAWIVPGAVKDGFALEEQRSWLIEGLRKCAERAGQLGLLFVCENIDYPPIRPLMGRGSDCRAICEAVDSDSFRLIYDICAPVFSEEDTRDTLHEIAPYTVKVHLKNTREVSDGEHLSRFLDTIGGTRYTGTLLDQGVLDIPNILKALDKYRYTGPLMIEFQGESDPRRAMHHNIAYLRNAMKEI